MDVFIEQAYAGARGAYAFSLAFQEFSAQKFPYAAIIVLVAHVINGTTAVHNANKGKPPLYWLHSLVLSVLCGFGGGIIVPVILGARPSIIFANDLVLPTTFLIWYLVNHCGFDRVFAWKPVRLLWSIVVTLWRTNSCINAVTLACNVIKPGPYYPSPLMGSIIGGTLINSLGAFVPFDKGLTPISKGTPWAIQSAFLTACMYFFLVKDRDGCIGIALRSVVGDLSTRVVVGLMTGIQVLTLASQVVFDDPSANFITPVHEFVYFVLGLQGPPDMTVEAPPVVAVTAAAVPSSLPATPTKPSGSSTFITASCAKKRPGFTFAHFVVVVRTVVLAAGGVYLVGLRIPPVSLPALKAATYSVDGVPHVTLHGTQMAGLSGHVAVGVCQWVQLLPFAAVPACPPFALRLEQHSVCANDTCSVPQECQSYGSRAACEASNGILHSLQKNKVTAAGFRLAVHPSAGAHYHLPSQVFTPQDATLLNANLPWSTELPLLYTSASEIVAVDPHYQFAHVELYLTRDTELYLVYNPQFAGSIFNVHKLSARVLWSGANSVTCANKSTNRLLSTGPDDPHEGGGSIEAQSLYLDKSGTPRVRCSDGESVELNIGSVFKNPQFPKNSNSNSDRNELAAPATIVSTVGKSEL